MDNYQLAQIAYQGYYQATGGKNFLGNPLPTWDDLTYRLQNAWVAAVIAIKKAEAS